MRIVEEREMKKLALVAVALLGGCMMVVKGPPGPAVQPVGVAVPNVTGMSLADGAATLAARRLRLGQVKETYTPGAEGVVVGQRPDVGQRVAVGTAVSVTVGAARPTPPAPVAALVPQVTGVKLEEARRVVEAAGLKVGNIEFFSSPTARGMMVVSQTPPAGTSVAHGSDVNLRVSRRDESVVVPNVVGVTLAEASAAIVASGLKAGGIESVNVPGVPAGRVASQRPSAGTRARPGSTVTLQLSTGAMMSVVPNVVGRSMVEATRALTVAGLSVATISNVPSERPEQEVIRQSPEPNALLQRGSGVSLVISSGLRQVPVPPVVGLDLTRAEQILRESSLNVGRTLRMPGGRRGTVLAQSPIDGTMVPEGSQVTLTVASGPVAILLTVPSVVGMAQVQATGVINAAGLTGGAVTTAPGPNPGLVMSQSPVAGSRVARGTPVDMVLATQTAVAVVPVPRVVGMKRYNALRALSVAGLTGRATLAPGKREFVLSQDPAAGAMVPAASTVVITVGSGVAARMVTVPSVVGMKNHAAEAHLKNAGLVVGEVSTRPGGRKDVVASQAPQAGARVPAGSQVSLVLWSGAAGQVRVPNLVGMERSAALRSLRAIGLKGQTRHAPGERNVVLSQGPAAGAMVAPGSTVLLTVGAGGRAEQVSVPMVVGMRRQAAKAHLKNAGLVVGEVSTRPGGRKDVVASQDPRAGTRVARGSAVSLVVWAGGAGAVARASVPNVVGKSLAQAQATAKAAGLVVGRVERRPGGRPGVVMEQDPPAGTEARTVTRVDLVVGAEATGVRVPQVVGMDLNQAQASLRRASLSPGQVTRVPGGRKDRVASQSPQTGTLAAPGNRVDLGVYSGPAGGRVPSVVGKTVSDAQKALHEAGYKAQVRQVKWGRKGTVVSQTPAAGTAVAEGTKVLIYVGK